MKNKSLKIVAIFIMLIAGMLVFSNASHADFEVFKGSLDFFTDVKGRTRLIPQTVEGEDGVLYCIQAGGSLKPTMVSGYEVGDRTDILHKKCWRRYKKKPVMPTGTSIEYTKSKRIPMQIYQDTAYVLAFGEDSAFDAHAVWTTSLNIAHGGNPDDTGNPFGQEAVAYKKFYEKIHKVNTKKEDKDPVEKPDVEEPTDPERPDRPGIADIKRVAEEIYGDDTSVAEEEFVNQVSNALIAEWKNKGIELDESEKNDLEDKIYEYYEKVYYEKAINLPDEWDLKNIAITKVSNASCDTKENFVNALIEEVEAKWWELYEYEFNEDEKKSLQDAAEKLFDEIVVDGKIPAKEYSLPNNDSIKEAVSEVEKELREDGEGRNINDLNKEEFVAAIEAQIEAKWEEEYYVTLTENEKASVRAKAENYYNEMHKGIRMANLPSYNMASYDVSNDNTTTTNNSSDAKVVFAVNRNTTRSSYTKVASINSFNVTEFIKEYEVYVDDEDDFIELICNTLQLTDPVERALIRRKVSIWRTWQNRINAVVIVNGFDPKSYSDNAQKFQDDVERELLIEPSEKYTAYRQIYIYWDGWIESSNTDRPGSSGGEGTGDGGNTSYNDYDIENFYDDENYYNEEDDYQLPTYREIDEYAREEWYGKEFDEEEKRAVWDPDLTREYFILETMDHFDAECYDKYEQNFNHVDKDILEGKLNEYYDKCIEGNGRYTDINRAESEIEDTSMKEINDIAKENGYLKEDMDRDTFINNMAVDMANKWAMENNTPASTEQMEEFRKQAAEYYDQYIDKDMKYDDQHTDIFPKLIKDRTDTSKLRIRAKRSGKYYIVGPFNVTYPDGKAPDGINKFSWISNVRVKDETGRQIGDIVNGTMQVIDKNGNLIYTTDKNGNNLNVPKNGEDFYIKYYTDEALAISVTLDFGYLESIASEAYEYIGRYYNWHWDDKSDGRHDYGSKKVKWCKKHHYELNKTASGYAQPLMAKVSAEPVYKQISYTIPADARYPDDGGEEYLDTTVMIDGNVFLDQDQGKVNEGNNKYDTGESLRDIDVWLYNITDKKLMGVTITDNNGYYQFKGLNGMKEYYVQFTYNGMLYTNVVYNEKGDDASKATEEAQNHASNRTDFNNLFKEIGSYPQNYETKDCITGATIKNKVYKQDEIVELYKQVAQAMRDKGLYKERTRELGMTEEEVKKQAYQEVINKNSSVSEIKEKVQFIADTRINAYTVTNYPREDAMVVDTKVDYIGKDKYTHIYKEQHHVNLGIKARPTFDLALYKDVMKAEVRMNGKSETYTYDKRTSNGNGFSIGVSEADYLNGIRGNYIRSVPYDNADKRRQLESDTYDLNMRTEEVANGQSSNYNEDVTGKVNKNYQFNEDYDNLKLDGTNKGDRLEIDVTYKISIRNQSGIVGAITEIVDYYDSNYTFIRAYEGDKYGKEIGSVTKYDTSMYGNGTHYENNSKYKTMYLRPNNENRLHNDNKEQYIYVVLRLLGPENVNDAGNLLSQKLLNNDVLTVTNLAEINGYKTYDGTSGTATPGLIDIDSNPGNLDLTKVSEFTADEIKKHEDRYEDDTSKAPALIYKLLESRTIEGTVFEDETGKDNKVYTGEERKGNGLFDKNEKGIQDVIVQLVEIKNGEMFVRSTTRTNADGWYGFVGFLPGNYTIRYIYGADDATAMTTNSKWIKGSNEHSYNGQDYQSTIFGIKSVQNQDNKYKTDINKNSLYERYKTNYDNRNPEETPELIAFDANTTIKKYNDGYYWYDSDKDTRTSDARDDEYRRQQVISYAREEYVPKETTYDRTAMANHKAEVFNSYLPEQPDHITQELNRELASELERRNYRFAYTAEMPIEVEYVVQTIAGTGRGYEHKITNVDFGIVERPKTKVELTKNVEHIKVTTTDGIVLFDTNKTVENLSWRPKNDRYKAQPPIQIIMDDELISGATIEVTYKITVTNNGELGESLADGENGTATTTMRRILDYVDNSLNFNEEDNLDTNGVPLWKVVTVDDMQNTSNATFINNSPGANNLKLIDLSTQQTLLQTTPNNPLSKALAVGETAESQVVLRKVIAAESDTEQLTYNNIMETIEIDNEVGRYDHESVPGNQDPEKEPEEDDTYKSEIVTILPPFGQRARYLIIGISMFAVVLLGVGVFIIKKYVVDKK